MIEAVILAGGLGTRLGALTRDVPKPMVPVAGRPFLDWLLRSLQGQGIGRVILSIGHLGEQVADYFGDHWQGLEIVYVHEDQPLGTGGAIRECLPTIAGDDFLLVNGDTWCALDIGAMLALHRAEQADLTIGLKRLERFDRYGSVELDGRRIVAFHEKRPLDEGLINTGSYLIRRGWFERYAPTGRFSFETEVMQKQLANTRAIGFETDGYFIDIGIPEDYRRAQHELPAMIAAAG